MLYIIGVAIIVGASLIAFLVAVMRCRQEDIPDVIRAFAPWFSKAAASLPPPPKPPELPPPDSEAPDPGSPRAGQAPAKPR